MPTKSKYSKLKQKDDEDFFIASGNKSTNIHKKDPYFIVKDKAEELIHYELSKIHKKWSKILTTITYNDNIIDDDDPNIYEFNTIHDIFKKESIIIIKLCQRFKKSINIY